MTQDSNIQFFFSAKFGNLKNRSALKIFINSIVRLEKYTLININYIFCSDNELLKINQEFLEHDYYTDIITFDFSKEKNKIEADVYVSVDRVKENAKKLRIPIKHEMLRVMFHGTLHLVGYNDKNKNEKIVMKSKEDYYLSKYAKSCYT